jgi:hypothetical protein
MEQNNQLWMKIFKKNENIVMRQIAGETILVPIRGQLADMQCVFCLESAVGEQIWLQLDGRTTLAKIHHDILDNFEVEQEQSALDLQAFVAELAEAGLIMEAS